MNPTLETIMNHRSIRKFTDEKLTEEEIHTIVKAAQMASTSSYVMAFTIIGVTDKEKKAQLRAVSGQPYVEDNAHLFVFCADLKRIHDQSSKDETVLTSLQSTEAFIVATVDASLAAQNAVVAAESMGLGICFLGSLRNDIRRTSEILNIPEYVIPLYGIAVGYPDHKPEQKPRFPIPVVYHENGYAQDEREQKQLLTEFDERIKDYYDSRSENQRLDTWTNQMDRKYSKLTRMDVTQYVQGQKLNIK
ncbi:oxygen-insensitive NADPH nitroreductase [Ornithinibacillus sp. 4-3]|uniref:Oxygen-insensitive NADPH nitroreductase n=1 Tax=Ornithinibacillus sp. 4-3 TaxID=3231488 RepID=A0AB39HSV3_9BACI